ncbi:hypothetical protein K431DRAFT_280399 [Polychaeton citri CBS 116435]|uniref:FAD-binding FR-type domain-containing protein n=1 Tax=Polychaeton citri CBS 116435 TaxID=1314669 RepID=A0A9P4QIH1_9PEZI|nr:hypothetical protein K431DRAFT_280399 [Polychaeton citri CBS 116435]
MTAVGPMRHAFYETFLNVHRLLVLLGMIGVYVHLARANLPQMPYLYVCIALWCFEYVMRLYRLVYHNLSRRHGATRVTIEALPSDACRVTFELARPWTFKPGCHVHAYIPTFAWWSSHPFSIAWMQTATRGEPVEFGQRLQGFTKENSDVVISTSSSYSRANNTVAGRASRHVSRPSVTPASLPRSEQVTRVSLVCRTRTGMTKRLYEEACKSPSGIINTWGAIEGPYGGSESLASFGTVVLFAGGVGVTHCVSYIQHLLEGYQEGTSSTRRILFVWSVPTPEALEWIRPWMDQILAMPARREVLRIQLYITKPRSHKDHISTSGTLEMHPGRCNPTTVLEKEMKDRIGAMGVTVCGPGAFADSVRQAVRTVVDRGSIDFVEEAFTY